MTKPSNSKALDSQISKAAGNRDTTVRRLQRAVANTVVGQMLPPGVVKGGTAMKLRAGEAASRFTPDLDVARAAEVTLEEYVEQLEDALENGWGDFAGTLVVLEPRAPEEIPPDYVMQPLQIKLTYAGRHWLTVDLELGRDEVGSTARRELRLAGDLVELFNELGLPAPKAIPVLAAEHQIVQKLHACTYVNPKTNSNDRAHDLVDLQILVAEEEIDWATVRELGERVFESRKAQSWPPSISAHENWQTLYAAAADGLNVLPDIASAVEWANARVAEAVAAGEEA